MSHNTEVELLKCRRLQPRAPEWTSLIIKYEYKVPNGVWLLTSSSSASHSKFAIHKMLGRPRCLDVRSSASFQLSGFQPFSRSWFLNSRILSYTTHGSRAQNEYFSTMSCYFHARSCFRNSSEIPALIHVLNINLWVLWRRHREFEYQGSCIRNSIRCGIHLDSLGSFLRRKVAFECSWTFVSPHCYRCFRARPTEKNGAWRRPRWFSACRKICGLCVLKLNLSGASIALNFNGTKRTESYKNEKSNILTSNYKQMNPTLFHISILNSFKKSQIYTPYFSFEKTLNKYWNLQK